MFSFRNKIRSKRSAAIHSVPVAAALAPPPPPANITTVVTPNANADSRISPRRRLLESNTNTDHHVIGSSPVSTNRKKEVSAKLSSPTVTKTLDNNKPSVRTATTITTTRSTAEQAVLDFDESFKLLGASRPPMKAPAQNATGETKVPIFADFQKANTLFDFISASSDSEYEEEIIDEETYQSYILQSQREMDYQQSTQPNVDNVGSISARTATTCSTAEQAVLDFDESFKLLSLSCPPMKAPTQNSTGETKEHIFADFQTTNIPFDFTPVTFDSDYEEEIIDEETYQAYLLQSQREMEYQQSTQPNVNDDAYDEITIGSDEFNEYMSVVGQESVNPIQPQTDRQPPSVIRLEGIDRGKPLSVIGQESVNTIKTLILAQQLNADALPKAGLKPTNQKKTKSSDSHKKSKSSRRHKEDDKVDSRSGTEKKKKKSQKKKSKHDETANGDHKEMRSTSKKTRHHTPQESLRKTASQRPTKLKVSSRKMPSNPVPLSPTPRTSIAASSETEAISAHFRRGEISSQAKTTKLKESSRKMPSSPVPLSPTPRTSIAASSETEAISAHFRRGKFSSQAKPSSATTFSLTSEASSRSKLTLSSPEGSSVKERKSRKSKEYVESDDVREKMELKRFLSTPDWTHKGLSDKGSKSVKSKESSDRDKPSLYKKPLLEQEVDGDDLPVALKEDSISTETKEKKLQSMLKTPTDAATINRDFHDGAASGFSLTRSPLPEKNKFGSPTAMSIRRKSSSTVMVPKASLKTHSIGATRMEMTRLSFSSGSEAPGPNGSPQKRRSQKIMYIPSPKTLPKKIQL